MDGYDDARARKAFQASLAAGVAERANNSINAEPDVEAMPSLERLTTTLVQAATQVFEDSCLLRDRVHGPLAMDQINRQHPGAAGSIIYALRLLDGIRENILASRNVIAVFLLCLFLGGVAFAQKPPAPAPTPAVAAPAQDPNQPVMTELQQSNLDRDLAKIDAAQARAAAQAQSESLQWVDDANRIVQEVTKANPDFVWHQAQGQGDRTGWMRKPKPTPPPPAAAAPPAPAPVSPTPTPTPTPTPAPVKK